MKAVSFIKSSFTFLALTLSKQRSSASEEAKGFVGTSGSWPHKTLLTQFFTQWLLLFPPRVLSPHACIHLLCPGICLRVHLCTATKHFQSTYHWSLLLGTHYRGEGRKHRSCGGLSHTLTKPKRKKNSLPSTHWISKFYKPKQVRAFRLISFPCKGF